MPETVTLMSFSLILGGFFCQGSPQPIFVLAIWGLFALSEIPRYLGLVLVDQLITFILVPAAIVYMFYLRRRFPRGFHAGN